VVTYRWRARDGVEVFRRELTTPGCRSYELAVADPVPGGYGWRWAAATPVAPVRLRDRPAPGTSAA